jgi:hypothetical protein
MFASKCKIVALISTGDVRYLIRCPLRPAPDKEYGRRTDDLATIVRTERLNAALSLGIDRRSEQSPLFYPANS